MSSNLTEKKPATKQKWFRSVVFCRVVLGAIVFALASLCVVWWGRRAEWAVLMVGGTTSTIRSAQLDKSRNLDSNVPEFASNFWRWMQVTGDRWSPSDRSVIGVNLVHADVDHAWLHHLVPMTSLEYLSLDQKQIGPEIALLRHRVSLKEVSVVNAGAATAMEHLANLPHLERLHLVNPIGSVGGLERLVSLRDLDVEALSDESGEWSTLLFQCAGWSNLQSISIRSQFPVTPGLDGLAACESLRTLEISSPLSRSDIVALSMLKQLTRVVLNVNQLASEDWLELFSLQNLTSLVIYSGGPDRPPLNELRVALPHCHVDGGP